MEKCLISSCDKQSTSRTLCKNHYQYHRRHKTLGFFDHIYKPTSISDELWFWSKVSIPPFKDACRIWRGSILNSGYGVFYTQSGHQLVHRFSYESTYGEISNQMTVDHACQTKLCVNPDHLYLATREDNVRLRFQNMKTCKWGHELNQENTYIYTDKRGWTMRLCRKCRALAEANRRERKRDV